MEHLPQKQHMAIDLTSSLVSIASTFCSCSF